FETVQASRSQTCHVIIPISCLSIHAAIAVISSTKRVNRETGSTRQERSGRVKRES
ncbi:hypothetical protein BaRGS_00005850, partial [Batillaria attramentaria]